MDMFNHQSNGAKGLRIGATVLIVIGILAFIVWVIVGCTVRDFNFFIALLYGAGSLFVMYIQACALRALASLAEVAQIYYNNNALEQGEDD